MAEKIAAITRLTDDVCHPIFASPPMNQSDPLPEQSPLNRSVTSEGKTVYIDIYGNGEGGWILEVVDERGNSTVWEDSFATDQDALNEALRTIDEEGIDALIGAPGEAQDMPGLDEALTDLELDELDEFLAGEGIEETSMDVSTLEGFLTAIAIGPGIVPPSAWLPWVWDLEEGEANPPFEDEAQAGRIISLVLRYHNAVLHCFSSEPASFEPVFWRAAHWGAAEWSEGFLLGAQFHEEAWRLLAMAQPSWFAPFLRLGTDEGRDITRSDNDADTWMNEIGISLVKINAYWNDERQKQPTGPVPDGRGFGESCAVVPVVREGAKIGRNEPCPCGSGKKFKRCCGESGTSSSLH